MNRRQLNSGLAAMLVAAAAPTGGSMQKRPINPTDAAYAHAHEVSGANRLLFVSGQVPATETGEVPADFRSQCRLAWTNVERQLRDAAMTLDNLVKVTIFLADRRFRGDNAEVRKEILGARKPAITIIITGIYDEAWLLEIEAVAAA